MFSGCHVLGAKIKGMVEDHHEFSTVFSWAGESSSQGLGQLSLSFSSEISNKSTKQKNNIYCWLFIMLLLEGYPVRKQRESPLRSDISQRREREIGSVN